MRGSATFDPIIGLCYRSHAGATSWLTFLTLEDGNTCPEARPFASPVYMYLDIAAVDFLAAVRLVSAWAQDQEVVEWQSRVDVSADMNSRQMLYSNGILVSMCWPVLGMLGGHPSANVIGEGR
jgi:hypothetical protein